MKLNKSLKNLVVLSSQNKSSFKTNPEIYNINHQKYSLKKVLQGETFRSVRKQSRVQQETQMRMSGFLKDWEDKNMNKKHSKSQAHLRRSLDQPKAHFKAAKFVDVHPKTVEEYGKGKMKEFKQQNSLFGKRKVRNQLF